MRDPTIAALIVLLTACSEAPARAPDAVEPVQAEAAEAPDSDDELTYGQMKEAAALFAEEEYGAAPMQPQEDYLTGEMLVVYDVVNCHEDYESAEVGTLDPRQEQLEKLARRIARHEHYLSQLFDPAVYREPLAQFESDYRQLIEEMPIVPADSAADAKWARHDAWRSRASVLEARFAEAVEAGHAQEGVVVRADGGCGAGETPYSVATRPADGTVWLTTKFAFDLCGVRGRNQWDTEDCRWTEIGSADETHYLAGRYAYQARWPDGRSRRGIRHFSALGDFNPDDVDPVRVTIAAQ